MREGQEIIFHQGRLYVVGEPHVIKKAGGWYVEYTDGRTMHSAGPTTKTIAKSMAREIRESLDGPVQ